MYAFFLILAFIPLTFFQWKQDANLREIKVMRRYHLQDREDYHKLVVFLIVFDFK
jgi:hypothetical protein